MSLITAQPFMSKHVHLFRSDSRSEHSIKDCDVSVAQSNISYGPDITAPSPASSVRGILSPSESIVPHLLGAMRSYEYESDFSTSSP